MSKITEYQNLLNKVFNIPPASRIHSICVYYVEDGQLEFRLDAPSDELLALTVKFIEDPILLQYVQMWVAKGENVNKQGLSHRFFRITGTEEEIQTKLMYIKMAM